MPLNEIASFKVSFLSILDELGNIDEKLIPNLNGDELIEIYGHMLYAREADQRMLKLQRQGRIGTFAPSTGQEASVCGVAYAMKDDDWLIPTFREMPGLLMRGHPFVHNLLFHNGFEEGNKFPDLKRTLPISIIVGSQMLHAAGIGYALKYRGDKGIAVGFCGDGGTSQGDFHEALNFAGVWQVPVVFVVQNNQWAISVPRSKQTHSQTIAQKAVAYGIPSIQVDGNDVLAVYKAAKEAIDRARIGEGPTLIESVTYRLMMHTTADDPTKYRTDEEVAKWQEKDPLPRFRSFLIKRGLWSEEKDEKLVQKTRERIDGEVKEFEAIEKLPPETCFDHVYGTEHEYLLEQKAEFLELVRKEADNG
mgnify:CR=1 FL=1